jgi:hypothetical protein
LANAAELVAGASILIIGLFLLVMKKQYFLTIIGCAGIIAIGLEKRGSRFERITAISVIVFLIVCFMFI